MKKISEHVQISPYRCVSFEISHACDPVPRRPHSPANPPTSEASNQRKNKMSGVASHKKVFEDISKGDKKLKKGSTVVKDPLARTKLLGSVKKSTKLKKVLPRFTTHNTRSTRRPYRFLTFRAVDYISDIAVSKPNAGLSRAQKHAFNRARKCPFSCTFSISAFRDKCIGLGRLWGLLNYAP
eukprot:872676-Amorphochlora_amoeboformis.AAC.2